MKTPERIITSLFMGIAGGIMVGAALILVVPAIIIVARFIGESVLYVFGGNIPSEDSNLYLKVGAIIEDMGGLATYLRYCALVGVLVVWWFVNQPKTKKKRRRIKR